MTAINVSSIASSLTGSTFDWQSFVDTMISYQSATITSLQAIQSKNSDKVTALQTIQSDVNDLKTAATALNDSSLFTGRTATSSTSGSDWTLTAASGATTGSYTVAVSQLATASQRTGASDIASAISSSNDVTGVTLATMPTAKAVTAGTFTVNGAQVTIALTDSLQDVFDKIATATGGAVTASYDHSTDKITLSSSSEVILGASNDSSNFLSAAQLSNNGTDSVSSTNGLGAASTTATLASANLKNSITAVDSSGNGSFSINGVSISYNVNTDSLSSIISRINSSTAGVTASYDSANDRMVLVNNSTGDTGFGLSESSGGFLDAVGLSMSSSGATTARGKNAQFTVNGGQTLTSSSNTFTSDVTGITGLTVKATSESTQTVTVASNTSAMQTAIQSFIDKYNAVQSYIDQSTAISVNSGTVTTTTLSGDHEVSDWASTIRSKAFAAVSGLSGTISRLADLGIDFNGTSSQLSIRDSTKLTSALEDNSDQVAAFFNTSGTGFVDRMNTYLNTLVGTTGTNTGTIATKEDNLNQNTADISTQITTIQSRLEDQRNQMITEFQAMEAAQTQAKSMIDTLTNSLKSSSSS